MLALGPGVCLRDFIEIESLKTGMRVTGQEP